ncbi:uncharacterized protein LOC116850433 isoform X1 [Odontomachus brunneus]|uniref:uncharacterized protein LOC116850433 isoform X1 n=1 Tax=Odontomachus brunneus TaxID=486640 RepID=UPI0013F21E5C|nr:uncharacterized protein LOC116850433 isoform X1 [Odontomachus brunneus]
MLHSPYLYAFVFPVNIATMLQTGNNPLEKRWSSFCSSCKSDMQSFLSIGMPSYLDKSLSSISNDLQDALQSHVPSRVTNNENITIQSTYELEIHNRDESSAYLLEDSKWDKNKDNGNNLLEETWPSFCSSCKSDMQSFLSIGVPSYLDKSFSSTSNDLQDALQNQVPSRVANNENKTMQLSYNRDESLVYLLEDPKWNKDALLNNLQMKSSQFSLKHSNESFNDTEDQIKADEENMFTNVTFTTYKTQKLNDITLKQLYGFINLKNHREVVIDFQNTCRKLFENLKLLNSFKSCDFNMQEIRSFQQAKSAVNMQSLDRWKEIRNIILRKSKSQVAIASKTFVDSEVMETDLRNGRRSVYKLAIQVAKLRIAFFSTYIRNIHKKFLLEKENMDIVSTYKDSAKKQGFFKNNAVKSCDHKIPQNLSMYSYNPLRIKEAVNK